MMDCVDDYIVYDDKYELRLSEARDAFVALYPDEMIESVVTSLPYVERDLLEELMAEPRDCRNCIHCTDDTKDKPGSAAKAKIRCKLDNKELRTADVARGCKLWDDGE